MRNNRSLVIRRVSFLVLVLLLVLVTAVVFMTYTATPGSPGYSSFAAAHHTELMAALVVVAVFFGFVLSQSFYAEVKRERAETRTIMGIVMQFLNHDERAILNLLVQKGGRTTQADVSRLAHMNRVKAHRSLQKMQERQLITIEPHGKVRYVALREHILEQLRQPPEGEGIR